MDFAGGGERSISNVPHPDHLKLQEGLFPRGSAGLGPVHRLGRTAESQLRARCPQNTDGMDRPLCGSQQVLQRWWHI